MVSEAGGHLVVNGARGFVRHTLGIVGVGPLLGLGAGAPSAHRSQYFDSGYLAA